MIKLDQKITIAYDIYDIKKHLILLLQGHITHSFGLDSDAYYNLKMAF